MNDAESTNVNDRLPMDAISALVKVRNGEVLH